MALEEEQNEVRKYRGLERTQWSGYCGLDHSPGPQVVGYTGANLILHVKYMINERITRDSKSNE